MEKKTVWHKRHQETTTEDSSTLKDFLESLKGQSVPKALLEKLHYV